MNAQEGQRIVRPRCELAQRVSGGIEVTLYWSPDDDSTTVEVWQPASEVTLILAVAPERALEAFYHPFAQVRASSVELVPVADA